MRHALAEAFASAGCDVVSAATAILARQHVDAYVVSTSQPLVIDAVTAVSPNTPFVARNSRISRPGLIVRCSGEWPGRREYRDLG
jgi:hypothetical protein